MNIPVNFTPRWYQQAALKALESGAKLAIWCWARRGGKDFTAFGYAVKKMVEHPMNVVLVFPTKEQGKTAFWDNVENDGFKTIEHIPASMIMRCDNTNMKITLINGSTFSLLGASDPESLRGANGKLYIFSEFVDIDSAALDVIRPIVAVNGGQIILQSTPKIDGISGGTFKLLFDNAGKNPNQYASLITAQEYLDAETLEELRQECILKYGNDFFWRQEYMCDWGQASATSYYGHVLNRMATLDKIGSYPYNKDHPVYTAWDLGMSDSTAIVFFQYYKKQVRIIDYHETHDIGLETIVKFLSTKPYVYGWHFLPHDGAVRDSDTIQRINKLRDFGLTDSSVLRRESREDGITRAVTNIFNAFINEGTTLDMVRKLRIYKRKFNPLTGDYLGADHKSESHCADSIRYLFAAIEQEFDDDGNLYYSSNGESDEYEYSLGQTSYYQPA